MTHTRFDTDQTSFPRPPDELESYYWSCAFDAMANAKQSKQFLTGAFGFPSAFKFVEMRLMEEALAEAAYYRNRAKAYRAKRTK